MVGRALPAWLAIAFLLLVSPHSPAAQDAACAIRGVVLDKDFRIPLSGARVLVAGTALSVVTQPDGNFVIDRLPPGTYTLSVSKDGYDREVIPGVVAASGRLAEVRIEMGQEVLEMDEVVVTGTDLPLGGEAAMLEIRETAVSVQDSLSSEIMSKAGAGDVASALKFVVGASVADGKYATVRGLSDRYTGTTLNGVRIPSADPRRRAVQVDMFPTGTIESLTVTKTFTPDRQGDFTGGGLDIHTRSIPDGPLLSFGASLGDNSLATGREGTLTYAGGGVSGFAFDGGERALPAGATRPLPTFPGFSARPSTQQMEASAEYDRLVRSFTPVMGVSTTSPGHDTSLSLAAGNRYEIGKAVIGVIGSITQSHKHDAYSGGANNTAVVSDPSQGITVTKERADSRGVEEALLGALATVVVRPARDHEVSLNLIYNRSAEDEARFQVQDTGYPATEQNQSLHYTERMVGSAQLQGRHLLAGLRGATLEWRGSWNTTEQDEPDVRFFRNSFNLETLTAEMPANSTEAQNTRRIFRTIQEDNLQAGADLSLPFELRAGAPGTAKAGLYAETSDRGYEQRSFTYRFPQQFGGFTNPARAQNLALARFTASSPGELWTDVFLSQTRIGLAGNSPPAPNQLLWTIVPLGDDVDYDGTQAIAAGYAMADVSLARGLKLIAGARYETTRLEVVPSNQAFGRVEVIQVQPSGDRAIVEVPQEEASTSIDTAHVLPSLGVVYEPRERMSLRATWSRTIARPNFRELAPVATEEFLFGDEFIGNPDLELSEITNLDLRWEWFLRQGGLLSASLFHKSVRDPIELISFSAGGRSFIQPVNFEKGRVYGLEAEARVPMGRLRRGLEGLEAGANVTLIRSELDVPAQEQESLRSFGLDEETRRLQGQPDHLLNVHLTWENERLGTSAGLFYNLIGETLLTGAARGVEDGSPNVYEQPFASLDVSLSQEFMKRFTVALKARNLLRRERESLYRTPDGEESVKTLRDTPALYTLTGGWSW
ncbi:MAG TPA: TonB-dependent receptor [Candidatus Polarisedimenticolia bacterium]|nr:TonB-dependent receptor [Candidatus Polarisedimenticolia bacterium]